jgi:hypothetical protein
VTRGAGARSPAQVPLVSANVAPNDDERRVLLAAIAALGSLAASTRPPPSAGRQETSGRPLPKGLGGRGAAILAVLGLFVLRGTAAGIVLFVDLLAFIGACIYALAGEQVSDGAGGIGGPLA